MVDWFIDGLFTIFDTYLKDTFSGVTSILSIYLSHILFLYSFISNPPKISQFVFVLCTYKHIVTFIQRVERGIESSFNSKLGNLQLYIVICCTVRFPFFPESFPKLLKEVNHYKILEINNGRIFPNRLKTKPTL